MTVITKNFNTTNSTCTGTNNQYEEDGESKPTRTVKATYVL